MLGTLLEGPSLSVQTCARRLAAVGARAEPNSPSDAKIRTRSSLARASTEGALRC